MKGLLEQGDQVTILNGNGIESPVVDAKLKPTLRLLNKKHWGGHLRLAEPDEAFLQIVLQIFLTHQELITGHAIEGTKTGGFLRLKWDFVVVETVQGQLISCFVVKNI